MPFCSNPQPIRFEPFPDATKASVLLIQKRLDPAQIIRCFIINTVAIAFIDVVLALQFLCDRQSRIRAKDLVFACTQDKNRALDLIQSFMNIKFLDRVNEVDEVAEVLLASALTAGDDDVFVFLIESR